MKRTRVVLIVGILLGAGGLFLAGSSLQAAKPTDTLNPGIKTTPAGPALEQPIHYSHKLHAGKLGMDCAYCHTNVDKSAIANIPNVETCMNCHKYVKRATGQTADSPQIAKLTEYYDKGQPIPWKNVHFLPEHANFNHKRHVKAGVSCLTCHGNVPEMDVVYPVNKLTMGFCVTCHKANREHPKTPANVDCLTCHK
jgi:hypothetical protein